MQSVSEYEANGPRHRNAMVLDSIDLAPQKIRNVVVLNRNLLRHGRKIVQLGMEDLMLGH